jgi:hypothetical protein
LDNPFVTATNSIITTEKSVSRYHGEKRAAPKASPAEGTIKKKSEAFEVFLELRKKLRRSIFRDDEARKIILA